MKQPLHLLPDPLLDKLVLMILTICPSLRIEFLSSFGSRVHSSAIRVLFTCLKIEDDCRLFNWPDCFRRSCVYPLTTNCARYAHIVKSLTIINPTLSGNQNNPDNMPFETSVPLPLPADEFSRLLQCCCNLENFQWESSLLPPDGICEQLSSFNPRLKLFQYKPCQPKSRRTPLVKWDAPSLPLLSTLPITTLSLSGLSQAGTRAFARMLSNIREDSVLDNLDINLIWFDENLCEAIAEAGRKIRRLRIGTNGTKLNDKGLISIVETCESLEELILIEVQGRITRSMWTKPATFPLALRCLRIDISETGPNHSWAIDHLDSLHAFPLNQLSEIYISRRPALPTVRNATVIYDDQTDSVLTLKPLPSILSERLRECNSLTKIDCDFWSISIAHLKSLLESCPELKSLKFCLDAPFSNLLGLASTFATLSHLHTISVSINHDHAPGIPPPFLLPNTAILPSPALEAPIVNRKSILPQSLNIDQMQTQTCLEKDIRDPSFPLLREVKRFVRRCPKLELLEWYGKSGRGSWIVKRPVHSSKNSLHVSVDYEVPRLSMQTWEEMLREDQIRRFFEQSSSWLDEIRPGQDWTGNQAEIMAATLPDECKVAGVEIAPRTESKKPRVPSISTSSSSTSDMNLPFMPSTPCRVSVSPVDVYSPSSSPLESPASSRYRNRDLGADSIFTPSRARDYKRSPSEPHKTNQKYDKTQNEFNSSTFRVGRTRPGRGRGLRRVSMDEGQ